MVMEWNDLVHCVPIHCNYFVKVFGAQIEGKGSLTRYQPEYNTQQSYRNVFHKENVGVSSKIHPVRMDVSCTDQAL